MSDICNILLLFTVIHIFVHSILLNKFDSIQNIPFCNLYNFNNCLVRYYKSYPYFKMVRISHIKHACIISQVVYFLLEVGLLLFLFLRSRCVYLGKLSYLLFLPLKNECFLGYTGISLLVHLSMRKRFNP